MLPHQPDRMEAVGDDHRPREPPPHQRAVRVGQVQADHPHALPAVQRLQEGAQLGFTAARAQVEDPVVLQIAEGGGEALAAVQGVFIDPQDPGTVQAEPFPGLAGGELGVDASDRRLAQAFAPRQRGRTDPVVMALEHRPAPRLRAAPPRPDARQGLHKGLGAGHAAEAPAGDHQPAGPAEAVQVPHPALIAALAAQAMACAARAGRRCLQHLQVHPHLLLALIPEDAVSGKR